MSKDYIPPQYMICLNKEKIAASLGLTVEQVIKEFKDARVISRFSEYWAGKLYDYEKIENSNNASYDGIIKNKLIGNIYISIKTLTNSGIRFQQSKYVGSGRSCDKKKLLDSFMGVDFVIVTDIINFPIIKFIPVKTDILIGLVKKDLLSCNGYKGNKFYKIIFKSTPEKVKFEDFNLYK